MGKLGNSNIYDIASEVGVSIATVSRVLNNAPNVKESTRQEVLRVFDEKNYKPKIRKNKIPSICLLSEIIDDKRGFMSNYASELVNGICSYTTRYGVSFTLLPFLRSAFNAPYDIFKYIMERNVDGVILVPHHREFDYIHIFRSHNFPYIVLDRNLEDKEINAICVDNKSGIDQAVSHLTDLGHTRIAYIHAEREDHDPQERLHAFIDAMEAHGLPLSEKGILKSDVYTPRHKQLGAEIIKQNMEFLNSFKPTALICSDDDIAIGAMKALRDLGFDLPNDMSIIGFGDYDDYVEYMVPSLTTIKQPTFEMGYRAAESVYCWMRDRPDIGHKKFQATLKIRDSCVNLRENATSVAENQKDL